MKGLPGLDKPKGETPKSETKGEEPKTKTPESEEPKTKAPAVPKAVAAELQMMHRTVTATVLAGEKSNADERETVFPAAITTFSNTSASPSCPI